MSKKIVRRDYNDELNDWGVHPILQRIYLAREVRSLSEVTRELKDLLPFSALLNIDRAVSRLVEALQNQQRILVIGDYDADGATSTALMVCALKAFGGLQVEYLIPNRFEYGYGLSPAIVEVAITKKPDLIITVDNGIASFEGVEIANAAGIDVLITDHHLPPAVLPNAYAIVNPNQANDQFPSKNLAGVGVAFYVMCALRAALKNLQWFEKNALECPNMTIYLDLVALGTVADVVPLDKNNRILVHQGLRRIRAGLARPGIMALLQIAKRDHTRVVASDMGYAIGPRLNAAGRLEDMSLGVACLLLDDFSMACEKVQYLDLLNQERRVLEEQMENEAHNSIKRLQFHERIPFGFCLFDENWHQGIIGLVASRIKEKYHRPVIAFAKESSDTIKGSARSVKGVHIRDILDKIATQYPGLITKFGGHAMAAGLSLELDNLEKFSDIFDLTISEELSHQALEGCVESDGPLAPAEFTLELARLLRESGPWGQGFPEPLFDGFFEVLDQRLVGERHLKLTLRAPDSQRPIDAIAFNVDLTLWPNRRCERVHLAYRLDLNEFRGRSNVQLIVEEMVLAPIEELAYA